MTRFKRGAGLAGSAVVCGIAAAMVLHGGPATASTPAASGSLATAGPEASASPAAADCPKPVLENPVWVKIPQVQRMDLLFPQRAERFDQTDSVVVSCTVLFDGVLRNCRLVSDRNPGWEFDKATLKIAPFFVTQPLKSNPAYLRLPACSRAAGPPTTLIRMDWSLEYGHIMSGLP